MSLCTHFLAFASKPWLFKLVCLTVAVPLVVAALSPIVTIARGVYS